MARGLRIGSAGWFGLGALALLALSSISVVGENEQAVILRMGQPDRVINRFKPEGSAAASGAGLAWHLPLAEQVVRLPRGLLTVASEGQPLRTADGQDLLLDTVITVRVIDPVRAAEQAGSSEGIATGLGTWLRGLLRQELGGIDSGRILRPGIGGGAQRLRAGLDAKARDYGVQVIDLRIAGVSQPGDARQATLLAMSDRRDVLAQEERNNSAREVQQITSQAEADAAQILQASAGRDPEFYEFFRAMRSYEAVFASKDRKDRATIVLSPDSGYLKQFNAR